MTKIITTGASKLFEIICINEVKFLYLEVSFFPTNQIIKEI